MLRNIYISKLLNCRSFLKTISTRNSAKAAAEVDIFINGKPERVPSYYTIIQALDRAQVTIPRFCYHSRLSIAGNCRMCLVQIEGWPKLQIACAVNVGKGMKIRTNSQQVYRAQESVLEFILADHPLDCPICDQGGECDLQDFSINFGNDRSRFTDIHFEGKRASENNNLGPLIRSEMTRCIHCTRCIRFGAQVAGIEVLGTTGRGTDMLIGTYVNKMFLSELSGNIIDLCPVGALTSIPYMFKARPWEIRRTDSIDCTDATGTNIVLNHRFNRLLRVLPREHDEINQEWLSDRGRWAVDSLEMQRLVTPMFRVEANLCGVEWDCGLAKAAEMIKGCKPNQLMAVAGPQCNAETLVAAKDLVNLLGSEHTYTERDFDYVFSGADLRVAYGLNVNMKDVEQADKILLVGTNPRFEAPILNAWIRSAYRNKECDIYVIGPRNCEYNYFVCNLGEDLNAIKNAEKVMCGAKKPLIFVGIDNLGNGIGPAIMHHLSKLVETLCPAPDWGVLNIITQEASFAGALEVGWKPGALQALTKNPPCVLICLGADDIFYEWTPPDGCCIIYIGFQGDRGSASAHVVLPGSAYTESGGTYLNMECRSQYAMPAITPPGKARSDWKILRALAEYCGLKMGYSDLDSLKTRMGQISPNLVCMGCFQPKMFSNKINCLLKKPTCDSGVIDIRLKHLKDYYCTDIFSCNSVTMAKARKAAMNHEESAYARN